MDKYLNIDLIPYVKHLKVLKGISKEGKPYLYLSLTFINDFEHKIFMDKSFIFPFNQMFKDDNKVEVKHN